MEQFFIHESLADSLANRLYDETFHIKANDNIRQQLLQIFFELGQYYGSDVQFDIVTGFNKTDDRKIVKFDT